MYYKVNHYINNKLKHCRTIDDVEFLKAYLIGYYQEDVKKVCMIIDKIYKYTTIDTRLNGNGITVSLYRNKNEDEWEDD